jgi:D-sedoheptulose 7-phosphate isomerase
MKKDLFGAVTRQLLEVAELKYLLLNSAPVIAEIARLTIETLKRGNKIILFGNGGSAADAQHIAAEIVGRFINNKRRPLPAIALTTNTSVLTSIANDYGFDKVFSRQVQGLVKRGDLVIAISTSGNSANVLEAVKVARKLGAKTVGFTGLSGGRLKKMVHIAFCAPSKITARIQECHITAGHIICELVEESF